MPGAGFLGTCVTPRDRVGQGVDGPTGRVSVGTGRPRGMPLRMPGALYLSGDRDSGPRGLSLAWARVARMCVNCKRGWRDCGIGRERWGETAQTWASGWAPVGRLGGRARARAAHESDGFFGVLGNERVGFGRGGVAGVCVGESAGGHWLDNVKAMAVGSELGAGAGFSRGRWFWGRLVI